MRFQRRALTPLLLLALSVPPAAAQTVLVPAPPDSGPSIAAKGGVTLANISFDQDQTFLATTAKPSFVAGGLVGFPIAGRLSFQAEGLYARRVTEFEGSVTDTLSYLEVPMLLRYAALRKTSWRVHVLGGVVYGRLLKAEETFSGPPDDIKEIIEPNDFAVSIGGDFEARQRWVFDFRYLYGLSEVYAEPGTLFSARQKVIQVTAAFRFW